MGVNSQVKFDSKVTTKTSNVILAIVTSTIQDFFANQLNHFNKNFYYSQLVEAINNADPSIVSNITVTALQSRVNPVLFKSLGYTVTFSPNKLHPSTLQTSWFSCVINGNQYNNVQFDDLPSQLNFSTSYNGSGNLRLKDNKGNILLTNVGTINYATGVISVNPLEFIDTNTNDGLVRFTMQLQEQSQDVFALRNNIIVLDNTVADPLSGLPNNGLVVTVSAI